MKEKKNFKQNNKGNIQINLQRALKGNNCKKKQNKNINNGNI